MMHQPCPGAECGPLPASPGIVSDRPDAALPCSPANPRPDRQPNG
jgi:hypothetical protein